MINFREAVAARENAETVEEIQHILAQFTERGKVLKGTCGNLASEHELTSLQSTVLTEFRLCLLSQRC